MREGRRDLAVILKKKNNLITVVKTIFFTLMAVDYNLAAETLILCYLFFVCFYSRRHSEEVPLWGPQHFQDGRFHLRTTETLDTTVI